MPGGKGYPPIEVCSRSKTISQGKKSMKNLQNNHLYPAVSSYRPHFLSLVVVCVLITFAFVMSGCSENLVPTANAASITHASASANPASYPVKVFFPKSPESLNNGSAVYPVNRMSPTIALAQDYFPSYPEHDPSFLYADSSLPVLYLNEKYVH
jgi:hypothetical protein